MKQVLALLEMRDSNGVLYGASVVDVNDIRSFITSVLDAQTFEKALTFAACDLCVCYIQHVFDGVVSDEYTLPDVCCSVRTAYESFDLFKLPTEVRKKIEEFLSDAEE